MNKNIMIKFKKKSKKKGSELISINNSIWDQIFN